MTSEYRLVIEDLSEFLWFLLDMISSTRVNNDLFLTISFSRIPYSKLITKITNLLFDPSTVSVFNSNDYNIFSRMGTDFRFFNPDTELLRLYSLSLLMSHKTSEDESKPNHL